MITPETFDKCWQILRQHAPESLSWSHYDLAQKTEIQDSQAWKEFLMDQDISEWLNGERKIMREAELAKLTANVSSSRSVGQAQLISALNRVIDDESQTIANGPAFIYCYIPLNEAQKQAPNVQVLQEDIFYVNPNNAPGLEFKDTEPSPISG